MVDFNDAELRRLDLTLLLVFEEAMARAKTDRSDSKCLFPARCGVIHHACWRGGQHA